MTKLRPAALLLVLALLPLAPAASERHPMVLSSLSDGQLEAAFTADGILTRTAAATYASRTITGTSAEIAVTNGDGVAGNPTLALAAAIDLGAKTSLEIPNAATPTVDAEGEIAWDTDDDVLRVYDGAAAIVAGARVKRLAAFNLHDPDDTMDNVKVKFVRAVTITQVSMKCDGGTNVVGRLYEVDSDGDPADQAGIENADWTVTTSATDDTSFANAALNAGDWLSWDTTSVSGAVVNFTCTVWGYEQ